MGEQCEIVDDLVVLGVTTRGADVYVDLYGSDECVCGSVRFTFAKRGERNDKVRTLERWRDEETLLTMTTTGSSVSLTNASALVRRALA